MTITAAAVALLLIGFSQTAGDARTFATRHRYQIDVDQESVAQGVANVGAGIFQGMPVSTSLSASSLNESAGARTPLASLVTGVLVVLTLLLLAPLFSDLPKPVLAALIIDAVVFGMIDVGELRRLARVKRVDFVIAVVALVGVLSMGVLTGVVLGVALSLGWLVYVATAPEIPLLGRERRTPVPRRSTSIPRTRRSAASSCCDSTAGCSSRPPTRCTSGSAALLERAEPELHALVLDLGGVDFVDSQGAAKLAELAETSVRDGVVLRLAASRPACCGVLAADGVLERSAPIVCTLG